MAKQDVEYTKASLSVGVQFLMFLKYKDFIAPVASVGTSH